MIILDTNVVSELMRAGAYERVVAWVDAQPPPEIFTTVISVFEIKAGLAAMPDGRRKAVKAAAFDILISGLLANRIVAFDERAADFAARLSVEQYRAGRNVDLNDAYIAGIVLAQDARLATRNIRHFGEISGRLIDPWQA